MGYRRLDINLLPPELQPGPVVRYAVVINTILIGVTVAFLIVDSFLNLNRMASLNQEIDTKKDLIQSMSGIQADYDQLIRIEEHVNSIGRLIALASADYVDMPVIMDRISRLLPDEVFLLSVSSQGKPVGSTTVDLSIELTTTRSDPSLLVDTFFRFKEDPILSNCYMRSAEYDELDIQDVLESAGISWTVSGPDLESFESTDSLRFQIISTVAPPVDSGSLGTAIDNTEYFDVFEVSSADMAENRIDRGEGRVTGAPEGVSPVEAY